MSHVEAVVCPNCGAPLELLANHACRWCRCPVGEAPAMRANLTDAEAQTLRAQAFERVMRDWTLQPHGPWIDWDGPPDSPVSTLRPQFVELVTVLRDGMAQPVVAELAGSEALDRQFCRLVAHSMTGGGMPKLCGVVMAIAVSTGTDAGWASAAERIVAAAKQQLVIQGSWKRGQDYQAPLMLRGPVSPTELRFPGLAELDSWVESKFAAAGIKHKRWLKD